ncbi:MAG: hypothetical protein H7066_15975 [Cytophagaceae bacterium]|nr:hypothetical protein [Gemmatimonadaceae bacterium]
MSHPVQTAASSRWPVWQRVLFRFFFIYLGLQIAPWNWIARIPGMGFVSGWYSQAVNWAVQLTNRRFWHVRDELVLPNGSGDTSWSWAQLWLFLSIAIIGTVAWSLLDRRRESYPRLGYWLRTVTRYYIAMFALSYGIIKIFALQMAFPTLSQLATPLGDFLPMRFSWLFIGYSTQYQVFSGIAETVAGLLLLPRRTVTLGLMAAAGAFLNVVMINLSYDVPVKIFASHLLLACSFLLALDAPRLLRFLAFNQASPPTHLYDPPYTDRRFHIGRLVLKSALIFSILIMPFYGGWQRAKQVAVVVPAVPIAAGVYDVRLFVVNGDTIPITTTDSLRWRDVIIDNNLQGSVATQDTLFWRRYRRGYFRYRADTATKTMALWKTSVRFDSTYMFHARYDVPDSNSARLWAKIRSDSVYVELVRSNRHFQLAERQFHWLSEYNR